MKRRRLRRRFAIDECVYCGGPYESSDHIPPKCLFADPDKEDLIEVPSCKRCNNGFSKDDEYLKAVLGILDVNEMHSEIMKLQPSIARAFSKPQKKGFVKSFLKTMRIIPRYSDSGLYTGHAPAFDVDKKRLLRVAGRIARGLFYHEREIRMPDEFVAEAALASDFMVDVKLDLGDGGAALRRIISALIKRPSKRIGKDVFEYWVNFLENFGEPNKSVWILRFYGTVDFLVLTYERDLTPEPRRIIHPYR